MTIRKKANLFISLLFLILESLILPHVFNNYLSRTGDKEFVYSFLLQSIFLFGISLVCVRLFINILLCGYPGFVVKYDKLTSKIYLACKLVFLFIAIFLYWAHVFLRDEMILYCLITIYIAASLFQNKIIFFEGKVIFYNDLRYSFIQVKEYELTARKTFVFYLLNDKTYELVFTYNQKEQQIEELVNMLELNNIKRINGSL